MRAPAKVLQASLSAPKRPPAVAKPATVQPKPASVTADDGWEEF
jgi:hypothetical protein